MFDWPHIYLQGVGDDEVGMCMASFKSAKDKDTTWDNMRTYCEGWTFPEGRKIDHLFTPEKQKSNHNEINKNTSKNKFLDNHPTRLALTGYMKPSSSF